MATAIAGGTPVSPCQRSKAFAVRPICSGAPLAIPLQGRPIDFGKQVLVQSPFPSSDRSDLTQEGLPLDDSNGSTILFQVPMAPSRKDSPSQHLNQLVVDYIDQFDWHWIISTLRKCISLSEGRLIHVQLLKYGYEQDIFVGNLLVSMYQRCGALEKACTVFDKMLERDVVSWTAMISAYTNHDHSKQALELFCQMQQQGVKPNRVTFLSVLGACASLTALLVGKAIHATIIDYGVGTDVTVMTGLVNMYGKCGALQEARFVFNKISKLDVFSFTSMIVAYCQHDHGREALQVYGCMMHEGVEPNKITFISILGACSSPTDLTYGKAIYASIVDNGVDADLVVGNALVNMYGQCGAVEEAGLVFERMHQHDVFSWTAMITAYSQQGDGRAALNLFKKMQQQNVEPDHITFIVILGCVSPASLTEGTLIHSSIVGQGLDSDVILRSALIDMYGKCGDLEKARAVFDQVNQYDLLCWNAIIMAYSQHGHANNALQLFREMQQQGIKPDQITFSSVLAVCTSPAALVDGKMIHKCILDSRLEPDLLVRTALVNMYAKCGALDEAYSAFDQMQHRDVISWNTMMAAHSHYGHGKKALQLFREMQEEGMTPDDVTFICLLSACSHAGLVDEGLDFFDSMIEDYGITPNLGHYTCLIDLLGRSGKVDKAEKIIHQMPLRPDTVVWITLLASCKTYGDVERGEKAAKAVFELDSQNSAAYVLLSNIYAAEGRWDDVKRVREYMVEQGVKKLPGCSWIEVDRKVHEFFVADRLHPQMVAIYAELERLSRDMGEAGFIPETKVVLHDVEQGIKEHMLCGHSEKLALAFGLISTPPKTALRITKNLRVCLDCHSAAKVISKIKEREIILRDASRFHVFKNGVCSCCDYW